MQQLTQPDPALAARILGRVGYAQRLVGYRVRRRSGAIPAHLYSFQEVVHLLDDKYPRLDLLRLQQWLHEAMGDPELAACVSEILRAGSSDRAQIFRVRDLMSQRLRQCLPNET